ncbi:glutamine amidotransferase [Corynebacterium heidelbergense]|uniref:Glutamine amidotransferase n=1 Tax=Corynebacterium heidelbergense TaxID=2055947 RepID=A0A364VAC9_9CORY|nr:glutamine amidotransferase [Corynebacterium heidelbergense]RAV33568.1 glutamine amidotransferase [Corynebacterium heidelbergense]WCZ36553.1 glutamine amidotransferase [Corynebacterium heidelbergense]
MTFVLISPRQGQQVTAAEHRDFLAFTGLRAQELDHRILDRPDSQIGPVDGAEGVFIGGSPFTITDPEDPELQEAISQTLVRFVRQQLDRGELPIFATCFGAGLLAHYFGGKVSQRYAEAAGETQVELTAEAQGDPMCQGLPPSFPALCGHKDSVERLPTGATLLARSEHCPVQMYRMGTNVWVSQFHPELDAAAITARLKFYVGHGYMADGEEEKTYAAVAGVRTAEANTILRNFVDYARAR